MAFVNSFIGAWGLQSPTTDRGNSRLCAVVQSADQKSNGEQNKAAESSSSSSHTEIVPGGKTYAPRQIRGGGRLRIGNVRTQGKRYVKLPPNPPGLRVAAGTAKGRAVKSPNVYLRPMMAKVREALFSMLDGFGALRSDGCVLDLFCGSGSVGIEALSRGMQSAVFVDYAPECVETTSENLQNCGFQSQGNALCISVEDFLSNAQMYNNGEKFDLITITPPYEEVDYAELMTKLVESSCVGEGTFVVVEYPVELKSLPPTIDHRLIGIRNRRYGRTVVAVYACQPHVDLEPRPDEFVYSKRR